MSPFPWSPGTVERLLILRAQGLKLSSIAADLGTTRSAIEHKLRRLRSQKPARATAARPPLIPSSRSSDPLVRGVAPRERTDNPEKMMRSGLNEPDEAGITLFDLRPQDCRWIVSGSGAAALYCGKLRVGTSPYCVEHTQRAWQRLEVKAPARPTARRFQAARRR
jgi:hypothetical protein